MSGLCAVPDTDLPWCLAVQDDALYVGYAYASNRIVKMPHDGDAVTLQTEVSPQFITADSESIYWTDHGSMPHEGRVMKAPIAGGTSVTLVAHLDDPQPLVIDSASVYWVDWSDYAHSSPMRVPLSGGAPETLTDIVGGTLALDTTHLYWNLFDGPDAVAILTRPKSGGASVTFATSSAAELHFAPDGYLYWLAAPEALPGAPDWAAGIQLMKARVGGGAPQTLASTPYALHIVVDNHAVYLTTRRPGPGNVFKSAYSTDCLGDVLKVSLTGGVAQTVAAAQLCPEALAVDSTSLYWANTGVEYDAPKKGTLMRLTPK
jgi:hypothetical protein